MLRRFSLSVLAVVALALGYSKAALADPPTLSIQQQATLRAADARLDAATDDFTQTTSPAQRQLYFGAKVVLDRKRLLDAGSCGGLCHS